MLKFKKILPQIPANNIILRQCFSILRDNNKFDPVILDVLIRDFNSRDYYGKISELLGKPYLSPLKQNQNEFQPVRTGKIYGSGRGLISLPTQSQYQQQPLWVHYLIDTTSPYTFLTKEVLQALKHDETQAKFRVYINTQIIPVRLSTHHFEQINLLGMDYLENQQKLEYLMEKSKVVITYKKK